MTRTIGVVVAVALFLGSLALQSGCASPRKNIPPLSEWVTFEGEYVSLKLPDSFAGGDPADPDVMTGLEEIASSNPDPTVRANLQAYLADVKSDLYQQQGLEALYDLLIVWGEPGANGLMTGVEVWRFPLDGGLLSLTDGDSSMEALVQASMLWPRSEWTVESMTEDRAYVILRHVAGGGSDITLQQHIVYQAAGNYLYEFDYTYGGEPDPTLDSVFAASAETAMVKAPYDLPRLEVDQTTYIQDVACQSLLHSAGHALERAYLELGTLDATAKTLEVLAEIEPTIRFIAVSSVEAAVTTAVATLRNEVAYYAEGEIYAVGSRSESGTTLGLAHDQNLPEEYYQYIDGKVDSWRYEIPELD